MRILLTGAGGMLGRTLGPYLASRGHTTFGYTKEQLDITDFKQVESAFQSCLGLELVIHCAAYTNVDQAESEPELAYLVNGHGTENLAVMCNKLKIPMVYISTDYVFDGEQNIPYKPGDITHPLSIYGKSKLAGELAIQQHLEHFYIIRTSWLYGPYGKNFVETIRTLAKEGKPLKVVSDQFGSPTYTLSLAEIIADLIQTGRWGIYHASDDGVISWFDFAREVTKDLGTAVAAISTQEMPRPAARPKYSGLDKTTLISAIGRPLPSWKESLHAYLQLRTIKEPIEHR